MTPVFKFPQSTSLIGYPGQPIARNMYTKCGCARLRARKNNDRPALSKFMSEIKLLRTIQAKTTMRSRGLYDAQCIYICRQVFATTFGYLKL